MPISFARILILILLFQSTVLFAQTKGVKRDTIVIVQKDTIYSYPPNYEMDKERVELYKNWADERIDNLEIQINNHHESIGNQLTVTGILAAIVTFFLTVLLTVISVGGYFWNKRSIDEKSKEIEGKISEQVEQKKKDLLDTLNDRADKFDAEYSTKLQGGIDKAQSVVDSRVADLKGRGEELIEKLSEAEKTSKINGNVDEAAQKVKMNEDEIRRVQKELKKIRDELTNIKSDNPEKVNEAVEEIDDASLFAEVWDDITRDDYLSALEKLKILTGKNPFSDVYWHQLGFVLTGLGKLEEALDAYDKAIPLAPDDPSSIVNSAAVLNMLGRYDLAESRLENVKKRGIVEPYALRHLSISQLGLDRTAEAYVSANEAVKQEPDYPNAYVARAMVYAQQGQEEKMVLDVLKAKKLGLGYEALKQLGYTKQFFGKYIDHPKVQELLALAKEKGLDL